MLHRLLSCPGPICPSLGEGSVTSLYNLFVTLDHVLLSVSWFPSSSWYASLSLIPTDFLDVAVVSGLATGQQLECSGMVFSLVSFFCFISCAAVVWNPLRHKSCIAFRCTCRSCLSFCENWPCPPDPCHLLLRLCASELLQFHSTSHWLSQA